MPDFKVFVGWDSREDIAYEVLKHSIHRYNPDVQVIPLKQYELREQGVYWRPHDSKGSTEFTITRFLVPFLSGYKGHSLFIDCDMIAREDITNILEDMPFKSKVSCVQHDYSPKSIMKMDGQMQHVYPRKNWSSVMLFNNVACKNLTPEVVNSESPMYLHRMLWANEEIGELPPKWNNLAGYYDLNGGLIHYTDGGPWFKEYRDCPHAVLWRDELKSLYGIKNYPEMENEW